jgi:hypothetical protein
MTTVCIGTLAVPEGRATLAPEPEPILDLPQKAEWLSSVSAEMTGGKITQETTWYAFVNMPGFA